MTKSYHPSQKKEENPHLRFTWLLDAKQVITDIARGEADLDTLKAGASLIPVAKITKVPKVVKAIGNVGKTGLKKGRGGDKTVWKRFTQEDKPKPQNDRDKKAETLAKNREKGRAFEKKMFKQFQKRTKNAVEQVTIKTNKSTKIRVDAIGIDKQTGKVVIEEYKSSHKAPLTSNQRKGFPELEKYGGVVVCKGKDIFKNGYKIPPTKVEVVRPKK